MEGGLRNRSQKVVNILLTLLAFSVPLFGRSPNINKYFLILLVAVWLMRGKVSFKIPIALPLGLYVSIVIISAFTGINPSESFRYFAKHMVNVLTIFVIADSVQSRGHARWMLKVMFISVALVSFLGILQSISGSCGILQKPLSFVGIGPLMEGRITSTRAHPLVFATNIILYLFIALATALATGQPAVFVGAGALWVVLVLTYSRMPLFSAMMISLLSGIIFYGKRKIMILCALGATVILMIFLPLNWSNRRFKALYLGGRDSVWRKAYKLVVERPLFGVGLGNVPVIYFRELPHNPRPLAHTHNTYLQILVASGIFALFTFLWAVWVFFRELLRRIRHPNVGKFEKHVLVGLLFGFAATGLCGMTDDLFCRAEAYYPIYFLAGLAMSRALAPSNSLKDGAKK